MIESNAVLSLLSEEHSARLRAEQRAMELEQRVVVLEADLAAHRADGVDLAPSDRVDAP